MTVRATVFKPKELAGFFPSFPGISIDGETAPSEYAILPGFADVHVHLRQPGFSYKEDMESGTLAAAAGGYTAVGAMPNLDPVPDSALHLEEELKAIREKARIPVYPYGALTVGEKGETLADLSGMADKVLAFSDDGRGIQSEEMMIAALTECKRLGKVLAAHCEDMSLVKGGYIHQGSYAGAHGHKGICSESEWRPIERDLRLLARHGGSYHVCHVSCRESVELIRKAKKAGLDVTAETGPHYLLLDQNCLAEDGRFKMNPPLRDEEDREALVEGILDGTIDMIATDHAPHSPEEKSRGLAGSPFGVVGLETAFPVLYTGLVKTGILSMDRLLTLLCTAPRERFGIPMGNEFSLWDLCESRVIRPEEFRSKGKASPFAGETVNGRCLLTVYNDRIVYQDPTFTLL